MAFQEDIIKKDKDNSKERCKMKPRQKLIEVENVPLLNGFIQLLS